MTTTADQIRVYGQPGCTSRLRTKEFLAKRGVLFESRDVLAWPATGRAPRRRHLG